MTPFLWSGAGGALVRLAEAQREAGAEVTVVTTGRSRGGSDWPSLRQRLRRAGIDHVRLDFFAREPNVLWPNVEALEKTLVRAKAQVAHAHAGVPACALAICRDRGAWRGTAVGHLNSWGVGRPAWMDTMDAWGYARLDRVVCISRAYQARLARLGVARRTAALRALGRRPAGARPRSPRRLGGPADRRLRRPHRAAQEPDRAGRGVRARPPALARSGCWSWSDRSPITPTPTRWDAR